MTSKQTLVTPLTVGEVKNDNTVMYWVEPARHLGMWFGFEPDQELVDWCESTFGPGIDRSTQYGKWFVDKRKFYFKNENDRTMFLLRIAG